MSPIARRRFLSVSGPADCRAPPQAQDDAQAARQRRSRNAARAASDAIPKLATYLADPDVDMRLEAVKAMSDIGTQSSLDPLIKACRR